MLAQRCRTSSSRHVSADIIRRALATEAPKKHRLAVGILLNRAPLLTRDPTPFEQSFYEYQSRIQRALHNPFAFDFYFKEGSVLEAKFTKEELDRDKEAFGNDIVGERDVPNAALLSKETDHSEPLASRESQADLTNNYKSLDRLGSRNLYLVLKSSDEESASWGFPKGYVRPGEFLHEAAQRRLADECGNAMNTWIVGKRPIGFLEKTYERPQEEYSGEKIFFFKGHIFAGQVKLQSPALSDFSWLTKEEIVSRLPRHYWEGTKDMLSDV